MTSVLDDPLTPNLMATEDRRRSPSAPGTVTARPFGLTLLTEVAPTDIRDASGWTYDPERQLNVTADGTPVIVDMPREQTQDTQTTVQDHQEWPDIIFD